MPRKSTGKRQQFEVFKRDHFTCQYCGDQPPDVVLVLDHITPVASGGGNEITNLVTACEACNQGKSDRSLEDRAIRPDADLLYLQTQQEVAELRRYNQALAARQLEQDTTIKLLQTVWVRCSDLDWSPSASSLESLLSRYTPEIVEQAVRIVAPKVAEGYISDYGDKWLKYLNGVAKNVAAEWEGEDA